MTDTFQRVYFRKRTEDKGNGSFAYKAEESMLRIEETEKSKPHGLRLRRLVCIAAWFGFLAVVKAHSSPGSSTDSRVDALLSVMGDFGYNLLLAQSWKGSDPCDYWCRITCMEGQIEYIVLDP
ncbi:hypothetical protein Bca52824_002396 [Brassica carinata]|uniref:Uncharacterized protein n=1 Tax=Brassica carinata TaxID=52824 RepID=A0A8X7WJ51_BRACI|nr:hypothetical protein Bca52824_002396 [Brassica carinata]